MDFNFTPDEEAFRSEVREFLAKHLPAPEDRQDPTALGAWHQALIEKKWIGFSWPAEAGGGGGSVIQQFILKEEMSAVQAPPLGSDFMGLTWVGPAIIEHGTDEQKQMFLPELLAGDSIWCTGYSEPGSGSDLASLSTRADRDGDDYVINGQKIWTTLAHAAKYIFMLVRTESTSRYGGITCLLIPMDTPGIEVQPIPSLTGVHSFNQVFFNDVRVPITSRLGSEGEGWRVVVGALANERSGISEVEGLLRNLDRLKALAKKARRSGRPALENPELRRKLARMETTIESMRFNGLRALTRQLKGEAPSSETSINKLHRTSLEIEMGELGLSLQGNAGGLMRGADPVRDGGRWQHMALSWPEMVIGGGTPNIQKNIIAERLLGLPKD